MSVVGVISLSISKFQKQKHFHFFKICKVELMGRMEYLAMKTDQGKSEQLSSDFEEFKMAAKKLANDTMKLGGGLAFGSTVLQYVAAIAAVYLLLLDRTNWKTNILTSLLVPYLFFTVPHFLFKILRGEIGIWIAFIAVVLRLFFPKNIPDWLEMPASLVLLLVVAPSFFAHTVRGTIWGEIICLIIGGYLLQEHIRASDGFKNAFSKSNGISNSIGILLLFVYPVWAIVLWFL